MHKSKIYYIFAVSLQRERLDQTKKRAKDVPTFNQNYGRIVHPAHFMTKRKQKDA